MRPEPFYPGVAFVSAGLVISAFMVRDTRDHVGLESQIRGAAAETPSFAEVLRRTTLTDRNLSSISQAGLVNNLNDGMAWGLFPLFFAAAGLGLERIGILAAIYPATWGVFQLATGALSDRVGRKWLIVCGMWVQATGICVIILSKRCPDLHGHGAPRDRHGDGVPDAAGRHRGCRAPRLARVVGRHLSLLARSGYAVGAVLAGCRGRYLRTRRCDVDGRRAHGDVRLIAAVRMRETLPRRA